MKNVFDPKYIVEFIPKLVEALPVTLLMTAVAMVGGLILGFLVAIIKMKKVPVLKEIYERDTTFSAIILVLLWFTNTFGSSK